MTVPPLSVSNGGQSPDIPPKPYARTDIGNAERLIDQFGVDMHYIHQFSSRGAGRYWVVWDGKRWCQDATMQVERFAKHAVRSMYAEAKRLTNDADKEALTRHAVKSESNRAIHAMLERAAAEPGVAISHTSLDTDPWLLTVANGELDLRTATLSEHRRESMSTKLVPVAFDPAAKCDRWESFLHRVLGGSESLIRFVQRAVGYSLTGLTSEQCLFFLYGAGKNGKTKFLETLGLIAGEYAMQADFATLLERKGNDGSPRNDIARLFGARVVKSSEVGEGKRLDEALVKHLTGSDVISARRLYTESFDFEPTFKLWLAANHKPIIRGTDDGIWRRIRIIPFTVQIPSEEQDPDLLDKLRAEMPGILAWAVAGCVMWQRDGLQAPAEVRAATDDYRTQSDVLGAFIDEYCVTGEGPEYAAATPHLFDAWKEWCRDAELDPGSKISFGRRLEERGFLPEKRGTGNDRTTWRLGIKLVRYAAAPRSRTNDGPPQGDLEI